MARPQTAKHKQAFEAWYAADRSFPRVAESFQVSERQARNWADTYAWHSLADRRDLEIARRAERDAINRRAKMIEDQRKIGQALRNAGAQYLQTNGIKSAKSMKDAVAAIAKGFELERQAEGLPDYVMKILNASENELRDEYAELLRSAATLGAYTADSESERLEP